MAKSTGKSLVIVESPAKARTISKFLGKGYQVEASIGHVRDLPEGKKDVPEKYKKEAWAYLGVDIDHGFRAAVHHSDRQEKAGHQATKCPERCRQSVSGDGRRPRGRGDQLASARDSEAKSPRPSLGFSRNHQRSDRNCLESTTRDIDDGLVRAQETRRILDRLYGFDMSQLLWRKVGSGTSAGRVQSVAVRLIVERERERIAFVRSTYWDLEAVFQTSRRRIIASNAEPRWMAAKFPAAKILIRPPAS